MLNEAEITQTEPLPKQNADYELTPEDEAANRVGAGVGFVAALNRQEGMKGAAEIERNEINGKLRELVAEEQRLNGELATNGEKQRELQQQLAQLQG